MRKEKRHSFIVYTEYREFIEELDDSETAELFRAIMSYADGEGMPEFSDRHIKAVFRMIANQMDRDTDKYNDICKKRSEAGKKGVAAKRAKSGKTKQSSANQADNYNEDEDENEAEDEIEAEDENDNENFNDAANHADDPCFEGVCAEQQDENFRLFIEAYPKRTAVKEAYTVWKKLAPDDELTRQMIAALEAQKKCSQWYEDNGRYIPKPANWLRGRRWEDRVAPVPASAMIRAMEPFENRRDYSDILNHALGSS